MVWKRVIDSQAEKLKELDKEIRPFRQNWEEADSMKSSVESLQNRVTELESVDKSAGQAARNTGEGGGGKVGQLIPGLCYGTFLLCKWHMLPYNSLFQSQIMHVQRR